MTRILLTFLFLAVAGNQFAAQSGQVSESRPAEYMIYQYPDIALVVKIEATEAEFESVIYGPENALIKSSGVPASRTGPLYQFIDSVDKPRQLMIKVTPGRPVDRSQISMELIQLPDRDWKSGAYGQAYKLMSQGTETEHNSDSSTWSMKIYTLQSAARAFAELGWEEMRLWSGFYAAHLVFHRLNDTLTALELGSTVNAAARRAGFEEVELAALVLQSEVLQQAGDSSSGQVALRRYEQLHAVFNRIVILADQLGLPSEKAQALFNDGLAYQQQERMEAAVEKFQDALDVSLATSNTELTNEIRGIAAAAYESQGSTAGAIELLEDISSDLASDSGQEYIENLLEKGRLLNRSYRFSDAVVELNRALVIQQSNAATGSWGTTGLELAWSYFSMGEMERARKLILESVPRTELATNRAGLVRAYDVLARIHRDRRQFEQVARYRQKQEEMIESGAARAGFLFESGIDAWKQEGSRSTRAIDLMRQSGRLAAAENETLAVYRASLLQCLINPGSNAGGNCSSQSIKRSFDSLVAAGIPWMALEAKLVKGSVLRREGRRGEALALLEDVLDDLLFFRQKLPGVLGGWYWLWREDIYKTYLQVAAAGSDGKQTLIALDRVRLANNPSAIVEQHEGLRELLARRETEGERASTELAARANAQWRDQKSGFTPVISPVDSRGLDRILEGLGGDETILAYYFSDSAVHVLLGTRNGVRMTRLDNFRTISGQLERLQQNMIDGSGDLLRHLDAVGQSLLQPVSKSLKPTIYLVPGGPLVGFPFDALRLNGAFLAEQHTVVNLMNLAGSSIPDTGLPPDFSAGVFLAGHPQIGQDLFSYDLAVSAEITAVRDAFVGPGLTIVQGLALQKDEFRDPRFVAAGLVHLAIPGTLDLATPDDSRLLMSRNSEESVADNLSPKDVRELNFQTNLVVLSRTGVGSRGQSIFDSRLGFVSDFLLNGARSVLVSLRSGEDSETAAFMADFYRELESTQSVADALSTSRVRLLKSTDPENFMSWAGFQLYIR